MNIILLSGGSGKRLWPLSNDVRSKQFIKLFKREDGHLESMAQRVYRQIKAADPDAQVTIATSRSQADMIRRQLGEDVAVSIEPCRRDTFPAIALTAAYLHDKAGMGEDEGIIVCPVDPYAEEDYFQALKQLWALARADTAKLILLGIQPSYPSEKYGYILPASHDLVSRVSRFQEKPDAQTAARYITAGGLWNGGVFACRLSYLLEQAHKVIDFTEYTDLLAKYETLPGISFDCAVVEQEADLAVLRFSGQWKDIGTWNTLTEAMEEPAVGNVLLSETCRNVHVINELEIPVLAMGLKNVVVSASPEGILVSDKEQSSYIKPFVDEIERKSEERSWGSCRILNVEKDSLTLKLTLQAGHRMDYHSHEKRDEIWTVLSGQGRAVIDGTIRPVKAGDTVTVAAGCRHTMIADAAMQMIEVQLGGEVSTRNWAEVPFTEGQDGI